MKHILFVAILMLSNVALAEFVDNASYSEDDFLALLKTTHTQKKLDCNNVFFKSSDSPKSLMGWSNRYHEELTKAVETVDLTNTTLASGERACVKTVRYRGAAACQKPGNEYYQSQSMETVNLCMRLLEKSR